MLASRRVVPVLVVIVIVLALVGWRRMKDEQARAAAIRAEESRQRADEARKLAEAAELARQAEALAAAQAEAANAKSEAERAAAQAKLAAAAAAADGGGGNPTRWAPAGSTKCAPGDPLCSEFAAPTATQKPKAPEPASSSEKHQRMGIIAPQ